MFYFSNCSLLRLQYKRPFSFFNMINLKRRAKTKTNFSAYRGKTVGATPSDTANSDEEADSLELTKIIILVPFELLCLIQYLILTG